VRAEIIPRVGHFSPYLVIIWCARRAKKQTLELHNKGRRAIQVRTTLILFTPTKSTSASAQLSKLFTFWGVEDWQMMLRNQVAPPPPLRIIQFMVSGAANNRERRISIYDRRISDCNFEHPRSSVKRDAGPIIAFCFVDAACLFSLKTPADQTQIMHCAIGSVCVRHYWIKYPFCGTHACTPRNVKGPPSLCALFFVPVGINKK